MIGVNMMNIREAEKLSLKNQKRGKEKLGIVLDELYKVDKLTTTTNPKQRKLKVPIISTDKIDFMPYPNNFSKGSSTFPQEFMRRRKVSRAKTPDSEFS